MNEVRSTAAAIEVRGLDVYYGHSHALQGVDLTLEAGVLFLGRWPQRHGQDHAMQGHHGAGAGQRRLDPHPRG
ncbi:ABC-type sugar transport system ATPase subunit [Bradyrhizobium sp. GM2.4]